MSEVKEDIESILSGTTYSEAENQAYRLGADFVESVLEKYKNDLTAAQAEIARLKEELEKYKSGFKNEQHKFAVEFLKSEKLKSALDVAVEAVTVLRAYPLDIRAQLKADEALDKIKQIKG